MKFQKEMRIIIAKKDNKILKANSEVKRMTKALKETYDLLEDTINVKLRYEAIIKKAIENEE